MKIEIKKGTVLSNDEIHEIFKCSNQGGMRRSLKTNTLVIVSSHVKAVYEDRWIGDTFHYTGMGLTGDQDLYHAQNKTVAESNTNGVEMHLFEVFEDQKYIYQGIISLKSDPYQEIQPDTSGKNRKVWIFPLKLIDNENQAIISKDVFENKNTILEEKAKKRSTEDLRKRIKNAPVNPGNRYVVSKQYDRNQDVIEYTKRRADGKCELCDKQAPFNNKKDEPYLEVHHIKWLSEGGPDTINNTVALCPNCHRRMHVLDKELDRDYLSNIEYK